MCSSGWNVTAFDATDELVDRIYQRAKESDRMLTDAGDHGMCASCERSAVGVGVVGRCPQYLKPVWVVERFFEVELYQGTASVVPQSSLQPRGLYSWLKNSAWGDFEGA